MSKHSEVSYRDVWNGIEEADNKKRRMENSGTIDLNDSQDFKISKDEKKSQVRSFISIVFTIVFAFIFCWLTIKGDIHLLKDSISIIIGYIMGYHFSTTPMA